MTYYNQPPTIQYKDLDVPPFIRYRYDTTRPVFNTRYLIELFNWAEQEYTDVLTVYQSSGNRNIINKIKSINCLWVLAYSQQFKKLVEYFDFTDFDSLSEREFKERVNEWNSIPSRIRDSLMQVKEIYDNKR